MRARASFKGHAIHQMLIPFPLAFLVGAFLFDVAGVALGRPALWGTAAHLAIAGVVAALLAAVPGVLDFLGSIPPRSSGKARGVKHAAANLAATALFAAAWWLRGDAGTEPGAAVLGAEAVGALLLGMGGWMGGTLVARNQIGVDHRYARAGKWQERRIDVGGEVEGDASVAVARRGDLEIDQMMLLHAGDRRIVLARTEDGYAAFDDRCSHKGASLADGVLICGTVQCPWHGSQFDVTTGATRAGPADQAIRAYPVEIRGDEVRVVLGGAT
jgi:nitrite reductase/ring-hydroxylating ferredoxin subunit/uncharacterized membrane protein